MFVPESPADCPETLRDLGETFTYKAMMLGGIPNFAFIVGYANASWTLKADLVCQYVVRLLRHSTTSRSQPQRRKMG